MTWLLVTALGVSAFCLYEWFRNRDDDEPTRARMIFVIVFGAVVGASAAQGVHLKWFILMFAAVLAYNLYDSVSRRTQRG